MTWREHALQHATAELPREACGLLLVVRGRHVYEPCDNIATNPAEHFVIAPAQWAAAEDRGEIVGVVHSHPFMGPDPSSADVAGCEASGLPWHNGGVPSGAWRTIEPTGAPVPLIGREFRWGVQDCYTLIRDWYREERGVDLPDFARRADDFQAGRDLYRDGFPRAGFAEVAGPPEPGDVLLFRLSSPVPDHGAVYLGADRMLHHMAGRLSTREDWGGWWRDRTVGVLRYAHGAAVR
jgi:proteasome lid subunit RPN8/RPN11